MSRKEIPSKNKGEKLVVIKIPHIFRYQFSGEMIWQGLYRDINGDLAFLFISYDIPNIFLIFRSLCKRSQYSHLILR